jgi:hypothetical protein
MANTEKLVAEALVLMKQSTGVFFLRVRPGIKPTLWRTADRRHSAAPVAKDWLCNWLEARDVEAPFSTAIAVLKIDFKGGEFPQLADNVLELVR